jgi:hypothetical protein
MISAIIAAILAAAFSIYFDFTTFQYIVCYCLFLIFLNTNSILCELKE